jgi:hypothetical protein
MKNLKKTILAFLLFCGLSGVVHAQIYRYDFIVTATGGNTYPLSDYEGIYVDLTAPSGVNLDYTTAIADWNIPTGWGTLNTANSYTYSYGGPPTGLSWNSSTITSFANPCFVEASGGPFYVWLNATFVNVSYYVGNNTYSSDGVFGYWQAEQPVPEPNAFLLALTSLLGLLVIRREK